ncbi:MAG: hypothetical protein ACFCUU_01425 [Cyclobacteriaceae bacterium]
MSQDETYVGVPAINVVNGTINPFPGLRPFGFEESHLFFGREGQSDEILNNLQMHRFTAIIGASGSGKSSIMFCGVIPVLHGGIMANAGSSWSVLVTRPGINPIENLCDTLLSHDGSIDITGNEDPIKKITLATLRRSSMGVVDALKQITRGKKDTNFFILVDQFEELFRFISSEDNPAIKDEAINYVNLLITAISQSELPVYVAITMRADFIGDCSQFPVLTQLINRSHYLIPQMTREQLRLAIEGPVAVGGGRIAKRLTQQLLNDIGTNADQLPVLQHALMRTWDYWLKHREESEPMDLRHYVAIGKVHEALSQHANEAYAELNRRGQEICEVLFKSLTEKGQDNIGTRKAARIHTIAEIAGASYEDVIDVVDVFRQPGRSLLMPSTEVELIDDSIIEISHESLMRIWYRLREWVDEEAESAKTYLRISEAAALHQQGKSGLWRPPDLQVGLNWQIKQKPSLAWALRYDAYYERAINFLEVSDKEFQLEQRRKEVEAKRRYERTKLVSVILGILTIISLLFFIFGWIKKGEADEKAQIAEENRREADRQKELAIERGEEAEKQFRLAEQSRQIAVEQTELANENYLDALYQKDLAMSSEDRARREAEVAEQQRILADEQRRIAQQAERVASSERDKADRLRMLSISQSMAVKSLNINNDVELKGNLALKAFHFNQRYGGNVYDNYIYDGLYYALRDLEGGSLYREFGHKDLVRAVKYKRDGSGYFSTGSDGRLLYWDAKTMKSRVIHQHNYINYTIEVSLDNKWLLMAGSAPYILALNLENNTTTKVEGHAGPVTHLLNSPNKAYFLSLGANDYSLRINDYSSSSEIKKFDDRMTALNLSPNGELLATANEKGQLFFWNIQNMDQKLGEFNISKSPIHSIVFHPDNKRVVIGNEEGIIFICDVSGGAQNFRVLMSLSSQGSRISEIEFSKNGDLMATASYDGSVKLWVMNELDNLPVSFDDHESYVWSIDFDPSGNYLLAGSRDGSVKLWPTNADLLANEICNKMIKNMSQREWDRFVGRDIPFEQTCDFSGSKR